MVWSFQYWPKPASYPLAEIKGAKDVDLELIDDTPDGGGGLIRSIGVSFSGRPVKSESVPKTIRWLSSRKLQDFESSWISAVSDRFRELIEDLEPGVHQFEPVQFVSKDGRDLGHRWFWQICNRLDSVNREYTNWFLRDGQGFWTPPSLSSIRQEDRKLVFDAATIGNAHFWHDMHLLSTNLCSDTAKEILVRNKITGLKFNHRDQV